MITLAQVGWASYERYEGPIVGGRFPYALPAAHSWDERVLYVTAATEGNFDSVNMYDSGVCSVGILQFIDRDLHHVTSLLSAIRDASSRALDPLSSIMERNFLRLERGPSGVPLWRRGGAFAKTTDELRFIYLRGAGFKGMWDEQAKMHAKLFAVGLANALGHPDAQRVQMRYTLERLAGFGSPVARSIVYDRTNPANDGIHGVARAAFTSFAVNNPSWASRAMTAFASKEPKWSLKWLRAFLHELVFSQKVAIWPDRYNRIRPRLESLFGVDLPDFAEELKANIDAGLGTTAAIQAALRSLGFDAGPPDGHWGKRTEGAVRSFQQSRGLVVDGLVGPTTRARLRLELEAAPA